MRCPTQRSKRGAPRLLNFAAGSLASVGLLVEAQLLVLVIIRHRSATALELTLVMLPSWLGATAIHSSDAAIVAPRLTALCDAHPALQLVVNIYDRNNATNAKSAASLLTHTRIRTTFTPGMKTLFWKLELGRLDASSTRVVWLFDADLAIAPSVFPLAQLVGALHATGASALQPSVQGWTRGSVHASLRPRSVHMSCHATTARFLELQTPIFRADAWSAIHAEVLARIPDAHLAASDHGLDQVWCSLLSRALPRRPACVILPGIVATHLDDRQIERHMTKADAAQARLCAQTCKWLKRHLRGLYANTSHHTGECWRVVGSASGLELKAGGHVGVDSHGIVRARFNVKSGGMRWVARVREYWLSGVSDPAWREHDELLPTIVPRANRTEPQRRPHGRRLRGT
mgnify:CR=1 FL=1